MRNAGFCLSAALFVALVGSQLHPATAATVWTRPAAGMVVTDSAPIGNGNLAANVYVDADNSIQILMARSDALSDHGQFLKLAVLKLSGVTVQGQPVSFTAGNISHDPSKSEITIQPAMVGGSSTDSAPLQVVVFADAEVDVLRVRVLPASSTAAVAGQATLMQVRPASKTAGQSVASWFGAVLCNDTVPVVPDTTVDPSTITGPAAGSGVAVFHRNSDASTFSFIRNTLTQQLVPIPANIDELDDLSSRVSGVLLASKGASVQSAGELNLKGVGGIDVDVVTVVKQLAPPGAGTTDAIVAALSAEAGTASCSLQSKAACDAAQAASRATWASLWARSNVIVTSLTDSATAEAITDRYVWQRYLSLAGGRRSYTPLKFNGMWWTVAQSGTESADFRKWGADFWGQNTRQSMQEAIASGDDDVISHGLGMYKRALPFAQARELAYWNASTGFEFPETMTHFGTYNQNGYGWGCGWVPPAKPFPYGSNTYVRFYVSSTLEFATIALDQLLWSGNASYAADWAVSLADGIVTHYTNVYHANTTGGKLDMFPAQAMETWQCADPTDRSNCVTDPITAISGLTSVLSRLLALPESFTTAEQRARWSAELASIPDFPNGTSTKTGQQVWLPGRLLPSGPHNSENVPTQVVVPYRITSAVKAATAAPDSFAAQSITVANNTFDARRFPCNDGWCWDVIVAAYLNRTADFASMIAQRATASPAYSTGWPGFSGSYQDYLPSLDELATMRQAIHAGLLQPLDDAAQRFVIFPTWPSFRWDVSFKLRGPGNTVVTASCTNNTLGSVVVVPSSRAADVLIGGCGGNMRPATHFQ